MRPQSLDSTEIECVQRRGTGPRRRPCSELRNFLERVDRAFQDRARERQHVRGEAHPLLQNVSFEETSVENSAPISADLPDRSSGATSSCANTTSCSYCGMYLMFSCL